MDTDTSLKIVFAILVWLPSVFASLRVHTSQYYPSHKKSGVMVLCYLAPLLVPVWVLIVTSVFPSQIDGIRHPSDTEIDSESRDREQYLEYGSTEGGSD